MIALSSLHTPDLPAAAPDTPGSGDAGNPGNPDPGNVEALIQRCLHGDQRAWDAIVRQYWRKVFNVAYKFVGRHERRRILRISLQIFRSLDTSGPAGQTWLIASAALCIDHYRSVRKERETIDRDVDAGSDAGGARPRPDGLARGNAIA